MNDCESNLYSILNRAIDIQSLIGTVGGYIGLFLGYSVLQIPIAIMAIVKRLKNWYSDLTAGRFITSHSQDDEFNPKSGPINI